MRANRIELTLEVKHAEKLNDELLAAQEEDLEHALRIGKLKQKNIDFLEMLSKTNARIAKVSADNKECDGSTGDESYEQLSRVLEQKLQVLQSDLASKRAVVEALKTMYKLECEEKDSELPRLLEREKILTAEVQAKAKVLTHSEGTIAALRRELEAKDMVPSNCVVLALFSFSVCRCFEC